VSTAPGKAIDIRLEWRPQRRVWLALALSALGVVICVALAVVDPRRGGRHVIHVPSAGPELSSPLRSAGHDRPTTRARVGATVAAGLGAALVAGVPTGLVVAAAVLAALTRPSARFLLTVGSVGAIALAGAYTAGQQLRYHYLAQFEWPTRFHPAHVLAWLAVGLLAGDALVDVVRRRRAER
jgi:arabinofuranan 3-O-arabinosyltransferase